MRIEAGEELSNIENPDAFNVTLVPFLDSFPR